MIPFGSAPGLGGGAIRKDPCTVAIQGTFTTSTGVFAATGEPLSGYSLGSFTSGVATLTFPKDLTFLQAFGEHNTDNSSAASRYSLRVVTVNYSAGTASVRLVRESDGATDTGHAAPTGTLRLVMVTGG